MSAAGANAAEGPPDASPTRTGALLAVLGAAAVTVLGGAGHALALVLGVVGVLFVAVAVLEGLRGWLAGGTLLLLTGTLLRALATGVTPTGLLALGLLLVVWDSGEYAITLGRQVGRNGPTRRQELRNAAASLSVAGVSVGAGWVVLTTPHSGVSPVTTVPLAVGLFLLLVALRS